MRGARRRAPGTPGTVLRRGVPTRPGSRPRGPGQGVSRVPSYRPECGVSCNKGRSLTHPQKRTTHKELPGTWARACREAGVPGRIPHDFRRTAVRNLERAGVSRSAAMKLTGHKTEAVYRRYAI